MEDWKAAVDSATMSIERLDKIIAPSPQETDQSDPKGRHMASTDAQASDAVVEISGHDAEGEEKELKRLKEQDEQRNNVMRIRVKALMRRAKAKALIGGWANLQGAAEDYQALAAMENLPANDERIVQRALLELPGRIKEAREEEMGEMVSKMKDVSSAPLLSVRGLELTQRMKSSWEMAFSNHLVYQQTISSLSRIPRRAATP